jgi:uncharacterized membrane protein YphA (DoxX/SURF4 family)
VLDKFNKYQPWLTLLARIILGGVLLVAGGLKVGNLQKSAMAVRAYELLPIPIANFLGYTLPWIEIGVGLLLILGVAVKINGVIGAFTMLVFIVAIVLTVVVLVVAAQLIQRIRSTYQKLLGI